MQLGTLLLLGLLAAAANVVGGLLLFPSSALRNSQRTLKYLVALGAGFLLAVNFIEIIPRSLALWMEMPTANGHNHGAETFTIPLLFLLAGYLLVHFFEQTFTQHVHIGENQSAIIPVSVAYTAVGGMLFHAFFDGIAIAAATTINVGAGLLVFLAIFLHKLPEGFTAASLILASGQSTKRALAASAIVGAVTFVGVLIFALFGANMVKAVPYLLPLAAGVALYVAASELIPELHHHGGKSWLFSLFVFAGVALFFLIHTFLHGLLEH